VGELEVHSRIFDEMGFLPATPYNKINIHVGGTYGDKDAALERFSKVGACCWMHCIGCCMVRHYATDSRSAWLMLSPA
jgi:hypothetical protein